MKDSSQIPPHGGSVRFLTGPLIGKSFPLRKSIITIGRDESNDIAIGDDPSIANSHARLIWSQGTWSIEKHPQAESLTINQQQVQRATLQHAAVIELGKGISFLFTEGTSPDDTLIRESASDLAPARDATSFVQDVGAQFIAPNTHPTARFAALTQRPDQTEIAPLSAIGI